MTRDWRKKNVFDEIVAQLQSQPPRAPVRNIAFACPADELASRCPAWLAPLATPREVTRRNPFIPGESVTFMTTEPPGPWPAGLSLEPSLEGAPHCEFVGGLIPLLAQLAYDAGIASSGAVERQIEVPVCYPPLGDLRAVYRVPDELVSLIIDSAESHPELAELARIARGLTSLQALFLFVDRR